MPVESDSVDRRDNRLYYVRFPDSAKAIDVPKQEPQFSHRFLVSGWREQRPFECARHGTTSPGFIAAARAACRLSRALAAAPVTFFFAVRSLGLSRSPSRFAWLWRESGCGCRRSSRHRTCRCFDEVAQLGEAVAAGRRNPTQDWSIAIRQNPALPSRRRFRSVKWPFSKAEGRRSAAVMIFDFGARAGIRCWCLRQQVLGVDDLRHACRSFPAFSARRSRRRVAGGPCSRSRDASRVKSLSDDTRQNPSNRPLCSRSMASITNAMSEAFFPVV